MRGKGWLKLKHVFSLDLVIVAAEWGMDGGTAGCRTITWPPAIRPAASFEVIGKTFKG